MNCLSFFGAVSACGCLCVVLASSDVPPRVGARAMRMVCHVPCFLSLRGRRFSRFATWKTRNANHEIVDREAWEGDRTTLHSPRGTISISSGVSLCWPSIQRPAMARRPHRDAGVDAPASAARALARAGAAACFLELARRIGEWSSEGRCPPYDGRQFQSSAFGIQVRCSRWLLGRGAQSPVGVCGLRAGREGAPFRLLEVWRSARREQ